MTIVLKRHTARVLHRFIKGNAMPTNSNKKRPSIFDDGNQQKRGAIAGRNIYIDDKGQTIMYISRTQTGYILKEKDAKNFNLYHNRIAIGIAVAMLLMSFTNDWRISIIAGIILLRYYNIALLKLGYQHYHRFQISSQNRKSPLLKDL